MSVRSLSSWDIEQAARTLLGEMLQREEELWPDRLERSLLEMIDPEAAARMKGYTLHYFEELGGTERVDIAAILDADNKRIYLSRRYPPDQMRFTLAHELGHLVLHPGLTGLHRDRPVKGLSGPRENRSLIEAQADRFAASFLMPPRLLKDVFEARFGKAPFVFDDTASYHLGPDDPDALMRPEENSFARGLALANVRSWRGKHYAPLAGVFRVSALSMAVRLEELGLIQE